MPRTPLLALLALLCLPLPALAQSEAERSSEQPAAAEEQEADVGTLQAELARVEAERQRLADTLAGNDNRAQLEQLTGQNMALRDRLAALEEVADAERSDERRKWFIVGGSTVGVSLVLGWLLARLGGSRKRSMWTN